MGSVKSGMLSLSKSEPSAVTRHRFPGNYRWPIAPFMLDRCFLVNRHPIAGGNELVVINTHNSAYDDGSLRQQQMSFLKDFLLSEYDKGHYIVVGGDWNQTPYRFDPVLPDHLFDTVNLTFVEKDYPAPGWIWAFDPLLPTNRRISAPSNPSSTLTTVIDYYLLSPNMIVEEVKTTDVGFRYSDHQPVKLKIRINH